MINYALIQNHVVAKFGRRSNANRMRTIAIQIVVFGRKMLIRHNVSAFSKSSGGKTLILFSVGD